MDNIIEVIKKRRSIRKFKENQIKEEELNLILEAAVHAPSGHNDQPWHFTVIQNKELIEKISDLSKAEMTKSNEEWIAKIGSSNRSIVHNVPTLIIVSGKKDSYSPLVDCSAAVENMMLEATSLNIGTCWLGLVNYFFKIEEAKVLNIKDGYEPYYAVGIGYISDECNIHSIKRNADVFTYIK